MERFGLCDCCGGIIAFTFTVDAYILRHSNCTVTNGDLVRFVGFQNLGHRSDSTERAHVWDLSQRYPPPIPNRTDPHPSVPYYRFVPIAIMQVEIQRLRQQLQPIFQIQPPNPDGLIAGNNDLDRPPNPILYVQSQPQNQAPQAEAV